MQPRINIITLGTKDIVAATQFYEQGLGFPRMPFEGDISFFMLNGSWLSLYSWESLAHDIQIDTKGSGFRGVTLAHLVESQEGVKEMLEQAKNAGATIIKSAQATDWGGFSGYFADLDGHIWEVAHNPFFWAGPKDE